MFWVMLSWAQPVRENAIAASREGYEDQAAPSESDALDEILSGFDEESEFAEPKLQPHSTTKAVGIDGAAKMGVTWNVAHPPPEENETDWRGLSRLRTALDLELEFRPHGRWRAVIGGKGFFDAAFTLRGRSTFTDDVLEFYEREAEWHEVYIQGPLHPMVDLKAGRQIVVWGRSDNIRITDVLNPLDMREPGLTDIEDLRLPVTMTRLDGYQGPWNLSVIAIHEIRFNKDPVFGSDFFPASTPLPDEKVPSDGGGDTEWGVALNGIFSGRDLSIYWAELFNDQANVALDARGTVQRRHARIVMYGAAANIASGNWLFKAEGAYFTGLKFFNGDGQSIERLDGLIGLEYSGWDETTVSWEWAIRHLMDFDPRWQAAPDLAQEDEIIQALRISRDFANDTLNLTFLALVNGALGQDGTLQRLSAEYDWTDDFSAKVGLVLYQSGDKYTFKGIGDNDRVFAEFVYRF